MFNTGCNPCGFSEQFLYNFPRIIEDIQETLLVNYYYLYWNI